MRGRWIVCAGLAAALACGLPGVSLAQVTAKFTMEGVANCHQPQITNIPIRAEGIGKLSPDRTAELDVVSNVDGFTSYRAKLGDKPTETPYGGTVQLRVSGSRSLRATREYPHHFLIVDIKVAGLKCNLTVTQRLKRGKRDYAFPTPFGLAYCSQPTVTKALCEPL